MKESAPLRFENGVLTERWRAADALATSHTTQLAYLPPPATTMPTTADMCKEAILSLKDRTGSSRHAIKAYIRIDP
jgi:hypothetical protein